MSHHFREVNLITDQIKIVEIEADQLVEQPFCQVKLPHFLKFIYSKWVNKTALFEFFSDDEDNDSKAVTMKDDILTAVTDFNPKPGMSYIII